MVEVLPSPATSPSDTKERLIEVAESMFADQGFEAVSVRALTTEAGANLAAVNYHFGSKEGLIEIVVARHVEPINRRRIELLDALDLETSDCAEKIVAAFLDPVFEVARVQGHDNRFCKLMSRCMAARDDRISEMLVRQFPDVLARFVAKIRSCYPELSQDTAMIRLLFVAGSMAQSLFHYEKIGVVSEGRCEVPTLERLRDDLVSFLAAGLAAGTGGAA